MDKLEIIKSIRDSDHIKVKFAVADIDGILRGKTILKEKFLEVVEKTTGFCDVVFGWDANDKCYDNIELTGWHTGYPDAKARVDIDTYRTVPWDRSVPFFLADFSEVDSSTSIACPRSLLKRIQSQAEGMGYRAVFSQEFEWFNFIGTPNQLAETDYNKLTPLTPGMFGYSMLRPTLYADYFNDLFDLLAAFDVPIEGLHTETGPGVYEAAIRYDEVLAAADKAILFKNGVKEIASKHGIVASFMAKWNEDLPGCSGHLHQSLWNNESGHNLFLLNKEGELNETMKSYLAGLLYCLPEVLPMYAPTINSFKRLREGAWAPTTLTWGMDNRTAAVRVINGNEESSRLEMRVPGSDSNPYLAMAASLASGLYGIKHKLKLEIKETKGSAYQQEDAIKLPANLHEASIRMQKSEIARELFGEGFVDHFTKTREWEWREYSKAVTNWELRRYFEII